MKPIIVTKEINASLDLVWSAITKHNQMVQWYFEDIPDFKAKVGFKTWFVVSTEERSFYHLWEVVEVIDNKILKVAWTYPNYVKEPFLVTFELFSKGKNKTKFTVITEGIVQFSHLNIPEFTRESCIGGWEYFTTRLKEFFEK